MLYNNHSIINKIAQNVENISQYIQYPGMFFQIYFVFFCIVDFWLIHKNAHGLLLSLHPRITPSRNRLQGINLN